MARLLSLSVLQHMYDTAYYKNNCGKLMYRYHCHRTLHNTEQHPAGKYTD